MAAHGGEAFRYVGQLRIPVNRTHSRGQPTVTEKERNVAYITVVYGFHNQESVAHSKTGEHIDPTDS